MIVELQNREDVGRILKSATRLRGTGISLHKDYPAAARERRRKLFQIKSQISSKNRNIKPFVRGETIIIEGKTFYFNRSNVLTCDDDGGMSLLQQLSNDVSTNENSTTAVQSVDSQVLPNYF